MFENVLVNLMSIRDCNIQAYTTADEFC